MLPAWVAVTGVAIDFGVMGLWFRYTDQAWGARWLVSSGLMFVVRLATIIVILVWACGHYQIPAAALGLRRSTWSSDFRWSFRMSMLGASFIAATLVAALAIALALGMHLPAPPPLPVQFLGENWSVGHSIFMLGLGVIGMLLVVVTEELIYRSLFLPSLTSRVGLYPAVAVTAIVFGLAHVIPFGQRGIPVPQIIGGLVMAAAFAIRWSVIPAMVIHAMGNLFVGFVVLIYVGLFEAFPTLFLAQ